MNKLVVSDFNEASIFNLEFAPIKPKNQKAKKSLTISFDIYNTMCSISSSNLTLKMKKLINLKILAPM